MIFIIHDNPDWLTCLKNQLEKGGIEFTDWNLGVNTDLLSKIKIDEEPPEGVFYNRVSPSSHTREARFSLEYSLLVVNWLEKWGRMVINGSKSLALELSKGKQCLELSKYGVLVPETYFACSPKQILDVSETKFNCRCMVKHNRSGSGVGVKLVNNREELVNYLLSDEYIAPIDGITLIQQYIEPKDGSITRVEIIDNQFIYGVRVDTSRGFNLCPADQCDLKIMRNKDSRKAFEIISDFGEMELIEKYLNLCRDNEISVCGIEFVTDKDDKTWTYDFNCNTNYNKKAEEEAGCPLKATLALLDLFKRLTNE